MAFRQREIIEAFSITGIDGFEDSFARTQLSLGVLLRQVAAYVVASEHNASTCLIDSLGLISRSCEILDSAFDETHDRRIQAIIRKQIVNSLEQAVAIKDKLSYNDFSGNSHPLRWIFVFVVRMADAVSLVDVESRDMYKRGALLLIDFLLSESESLESSQNLSPDEESVRQEQISALQTLRDRLVSA